MVTRHQESTFWKSDTNDDAKRKDSTTGRHRKSAGDWPDEIDLSVFFARAPSRRDVPGAAKPTNGALSAREHYSGPVALHMDAWDAESFDTASESSMGYSGASASSERLVRNDLRQFPPSLGWISFTQQAPPLRAPPDHHPASQHASPDHRRSRGTPPPPPSIVHRSPHNAVASLWTSYFDQQEKVRRRRKAMGDLRAEMRDIRCKEEEVERKWEVAVRAQQQRKTRANEALGDKLYNELMEMRSQYKTAAASYDALDLDMNRQESKLQVAEVKFFEGFFREYGGHVPDEEARQMVGWRMQPETRDGRLGVSLGTPSGLGRPPAMPAGLPPGFPSGGPFALDAGAPPGIGMAVEPRDFARSPASSSSGAPAVPAGVATGAPTGDPRGGLVGVPASMHMEAPEHMEHAWTSGTAPLPPPRTAPRDSHAAQDVPNPALLGISGDRQSDVDPLYQLLISTIQRKNRAAETYADMEQEREGILSDLETAVLKERMRTGQMPSKHDIAHIKAGPQPGRETEFQAMYAPYIHWSDMDYLVQFEDNAGPVRAKIDKQTQRADKLLALCMDVGALPKHMPDTEEYIIFGATEGIRSDTWESVVLDGPPSGAMDPSCLDNPEFPLLLTSPKHVLGRIPLTAKQALQISLSLPENDPTRAQRVEECVKEYGIYTILNRVVAESKSDFINRWLLQQLRLSPLEVEVLYTIFTAKLRVVDRRVWQQDVLYFWSRDAGNREQDVFFGLMTASDSMMAEESFVDGPPSSVGPAPYPPPPDPCFSRGIS